MFLPYVYKLTNIKTNEYYFGYRFKNVSLRKRPEEDIGVIYFTSSKYVKPRFSEFKIEIIAEFFYSDDAYVHEQELIMAAITDPLCLNKHYQFNGSKKFRHTDKHSIKSKEKMSGPRGKINRTAPGHPAWNKGLNRETDERVKKISESRKLAGNPHQVGKKYSPDRIEKIRTKLKGRKMSADQIEKMSNAKKGKSWEEIYGYAEVLKRRAKISSKKGKEHQRSIVVVTPHGVFDSLSIATKQVNLSDTTIRKRCKSNDEKWKDWYYLD